MADAEPEVRFGLLGPVSAGYGGASVDLPSVRQRMVLAALLLRPNQTINAQDLASLIWDGTSPEQAAMTLRSYVMRLRRSLGPELGARIRTRSPGYVVEIRHESELDTLHFAELRRCSQAAAALSDWEGAADWLRAALALWRGTPLEDVPESALGLAELPGLLEGKIQAHEGLAEAELQLGRHGAVLERIRGLQSDHPYREHLSCLLMRAQAAAGRRAEALEEFQRLRRTLVAELGVEPGAESRNLQAAILAADRPVGAGAEIEAGDVADASREIRGIGAAGVAGVAGTGFIAAASASGSAGGADGAGSNVGNHDAGRRAGVDDRGGTSGGPPVPRQLPVEAMDFIGRADQISRLVDALTPGDSARPEGATRLAAVAGPGGIGKTTLAVHVAHRLREHYPDGQLYACLRTEAGEVVAPGTVLGRFLRALGTAPEAVVADPEERALAFRSLLAHQRVLIVLDDVRDAAQIAPLLPASSGCGVLLTGRRRLTGLPGLAGIELGFFAEDDASALFSALVGPVRVAAEPQGVAEVLRACAGLPLALRIAGARLDSRPHWRIADLARRLADTQGRLDELAVGDQAVRAGLAVSVDALGDDPAARAFSLLGLWTGEFLPLPAACSLLGVGRREAERLLDELVDAQLLQSPAPGRYRFHDLVRVYAAERAAAELPGDEAGAAVNRLVSWYTHVVCRADLVLSPGRRAPVQPDPVAGLGPLPEFGSAAEAVQWCDGEHANLVAAALLARAAGLNRLAWQLPLAMWGFLHLRGHFADWIATHESALAAATEAQELLARAYVHNHLAIALLRTERIGEATVHLEAAIELNLELGNPASAAAALNNLAIATVEDGRPDDAIGYLHRAIEHRRASGDKRGEAYSQANLGETYFRTGRTAEAIPRYHSAIALYRESGSGGEAPAQVLYNLAVAHAALGESDLARARGAESAQTSRDVADHRREGEVLEWLGGVSLEAGDAEAAGEEWTRAAALMRELDPAAADRIDARLAELPTRLTPEKSGG